MPAWGAQSAANAVVGASSLLRRAQGVMGNCPSTLRLLDRIDLVCSDELPSPSITSNGRKESGRDESIPKNELSMTEVKDKCTTFCLSEDSALLHRGQSLVPFRNTGQQQAKRPLIENLLLVENQSEQPRCSLVVQQMPSVDAVFHTSDPQSLRQVSENYLQLSSSEQPSASSALPPKTDQTMCPARHQNQKLTPRLAVHKHTPINTSTGSSTSGVEISSSSSRSDAPHYPCRKSVQIIESSYDAEDLSSPEDSDNPLYFYRTPSFKKAIERGSAPDYDDLYAVGRNTRSDRLEPLPYYPFHHELQNAPSGLPLKSSVSTKVPHLIPPPYPFNASPESSLKHGKSPASSAHEASSKQSSLRSFAIPKTELDAVAKSGMDMKRENINEIVNQYSASQEQGSSPNSRWRCLSTLTEEELTEGPGSNSKNTSKPPMSRLPANFQPSSSPANVRKTTELMSPHSPASLEKASLSSQAPSPYLSNGAEQKTMVLATDELSNHDILSPRRQNRAEHILPSSSSTIATESFPVENRNQSPTGLLCKSSADKTENIHTDLTPKAAKAEPAVKNISSLGRDRRRSLQEMRHICNNAEMPEDDDASEIAKSPDDDQSTFGSELYLTADPSEDSIWEASLSPKESIFPSLSDTMLARIGLRSDGSNSTKDLPDDVSLLETEEKFSSLALAFQTDKLTLDRRRELHLRARDVAEENIHKELEGLKDGMKALNQICNNPSSQQIFSKVQRHIEVLENAIARMSSRAEVHGAVQQELRVNQAIDVMVKHVENLKRVYEKEHAELLEARKTLRSTRQDSRDLGGSDTSRTSNQPGLPQFRANRRRASIAVISKNPLQLRNSLSSLKSSDNPSRLVHRNSSFVISPLCFEEENEESESTDIPRSLARRKSSSIIEDLPTDFLSRLQASSSQSREECQKDMEEEKEEEAEPDENTCKDPVMRDFESRALETEPSSDAMEYSSCSQNSVPLKRMLSRKKSLRAMIPSKLQKLKEKLHPYFPRVRFQDKTHQFLVISVIAISACVILSVWLGWFHFVFGRLFKWQVNRAGG